MTEVTRENYYSQELNMEYMGYTQFRSFQKCEAAALAQLIGKYNPPVTTALLVGSYVDSYFSGEIELFQAEHPEIFKRDGSLKAEYIHAEKIISSMENDRLYSLLMSGKKQVIRTGMIAGVPFKIRIDSLIDSVTCQTIAGEFPEAAKALGMCDGAIVDQKVMRSFEPIWSDDELRKVNFVESWGYDIQGAIYQEIEGNMLPFILAASTKDDIPVLNALYIPDDDLAAKLAEVEDAVPRYHAIKQGRIEPASCGVCPYCRTARRLSKIVDYRYFDYARN